MARPSKAVKRIKKVTVTFTVLEHVVLEKFAKKCPVQKSVLCRQVITDFLNNRKSILTVPEEVKQAKTELRRIGSNINQIAKRIHTDRQVTLKTQLAFNEKIDETLSVLKKIENDLQASTVQQRPERNTLRRKQEGSRTDNEQ